MLNITPEEQAIWQSSALKNLTLVFSDGTVLDNNDICAESMEFEQTIADGTMTLFGSVFASVFRVRVFDNGDGYAGLKVNPMLNIVSEDGYAHLVDSQGRNLTDGSGNILTIKSGTYTKRLGDFTVISDKLSADGIYRELVCYDELYSVLQTDYSGWHNSLSYPITVKGYREAFFEHIGIREERNVSLINDSMYVNKNPSTQLSGANILGSIMAINAVWGYIGWDGRFHYIVPKTTADIVVNDNSYVQGSCAFEEYVTQEFTKVSFNISAETSEGTVDNTIDVGTDGGNTLTITDNCLMFNKTQADCQTIGNNILTQLDGFSYRPTTVQFPPYMGLELGDTFTINTNNSRSTTFPVLSRRLTGISALRDTFSAEGAELLHENANSLIKKVAQIAVNTAGANLAARSALTRVSTVDEVVDILGWVGDYGEYEATSDTEVVSGKYYFTKDSEQTVEPTVETQSLRGGMMLMASSLTATANETEPTATGYTYVENPTGNPSENGYYELSGVSSAVSKYLKTHLKMESDGLYVLLDDSGFRLRITNTAVQVINESGTVVGEYSTTTTIGDSTANHVYIDADSVDVMSDDSTVVASFGETTVIGDTTVSDTRDDNHNYITISPTDGIYFTQTFGGYDPDDPQFPEALRYAKLYGTVEVTGHGYQTYSALDLADSMIASHSNDGLYIDATGTNEKAIYLEGDGGIYLNGEDYTLSASTISLWESILGL